MSPLDRESQQGQVLVRTVEHRFGLRLIPALRSRLVETAQRLILAGAARSLAEVAAKMKVGSETDPVVAAMRNAASIGETFFFRGMSQLNHLVKAASEQIVPRRLEARAPLSIWSAACSTGEEAYTLAILFLERFPGLELRVSGTDMNPAAIEIARRGAYGSFSFRATTGLQKANSAGSLSRWCRPLVPDRWQVEPALQARVRFFELNLVKGALPDPSRGLAGVDIVVCRNVLIYIEPWEIPKLMRRISEASAAQTLLLLAPSECSAGSHLPDYQDRGLGLYARDRTAAAVARARPSRPAVVPARTPPTRSALPAKRAEPDPGPVPTPIPQARPASDANPLAEALTLADRGQLPEARAVLNQVLASSPATSVAHCLLGQILATEQRYGEALECYRRALFHDRSLVAAELGSAQVSRRLGNAEAALAHLARCRRLLESTDGDAVVDVLALPVSVVRRLVEAETNG